MVDFPPCDDTCGALEEHVRRFFDARQIDVFGWSAGPVVEANPHFHALRIAPDEPADVWTYVSIGGWASRADDDFGLEFVLSMETPDDRAAELLAMTVLYDQRHKLGIGHTLPIGEPWLPGSACDQLLVSAPYPFGPDLQTCHVGDRHVEFLWLVPITAAERAWKVSAGLEVLEDRFEEVGLRYWQVDRASVV